MGKIGKRIITAIVALIVVLFVAFFVADHVILNKTFEKRDQVIQPGGSMPTFAEYAATHARMPVEFTMGDATLRGYIYESNVDVATEQLDAIEAANMYDANLAVFEVVKSMAQKALNIGKG